MAVQHRLRGSGITERNQLAFTGSAQDVFDTIRAAAAANDWSAWLNNTESAAKLILEAEGLEPKKDDPAMPVLDDTPADYALRILRYVEIVRGAELRGNAQEAAQAGTRLGMLINEVDMKEAFERRVLAALKLSDAGRRGAETSAASRQGAIKARDIALAREFENLWQDSKLSKTALMIKIGAKKGLRRQSAIDAIQRGQKKLSGQGAKPDD